MRPSLKSKLLAVTVLAVLGLGLVVGRRTAETSPVVAAPDKASPSSDEVMPTTEGRAVLNRAWFDRLPSSARDDADLWIFFSSGIGVLFSGSAYRWSSEVFDFERQKNRLEIVALQDRKTTRISFEIKACDDKPPFDLCLYPSEPLRGKKVLYGFGDEGDAAHRFDWFREAREGRIRSFASR